MTLGQIVYSKAGRDSGKKFIIVGIIDKANVLISDGNLRRLEKPKRKKVKHIKGTGEVIEQIGEKLRNGQKITNSEVRKALAAYEKEF